jgi:hypothetical protein
MKSQRMINYYAFADLEVVKGIYTINTINTINNIKGAKYESR